MTSPGIFGYFKPGLHVDETVHNLDTRSLVEVRSRVRLFFSGGVCVLLSP